MHVQGNWTILHWFLLPPCDEKGEKGGGGGGLGSRHWQQDRDGISPVGFASSHGFVEVAAALQTRQQQLLQLEQLLGADGSPPIPPAETEKKAIETDFLV